MKYNYNGTEIELRDTLCKLWNEEPGTMVPQANLYVRVTNTCNAHCKFCEYHGKQTEFNIEKFEKALEDLRDRGIVGKIQITGGEPSTVANLYDIVNLIRAYFPDRFIGINSNGYDLLRLIEVKDLVDNFAISRHHYDENVNSQIFDCNTVPLDNKLRVFIDIVGKDKIHFSCNLIKNYIDNINEVKKYLDWVSSIGGNDVGFVTLMDINDFCKENQILFDNIGLENSYGIYKYREYTKCDNCCKCANYMYHCRETNQIVDIYGRFVINSSGSTGLISFDGQNLRAGFNGEIISKHYLKDNK